MRFLNFLWQINIRLGGGQNTTSPINKKGKTIKIISIIILLILIVISISFALGNIDINILGRRNIKISKCELDINFKESEELMLVSKYPITKEEALKYIAKEITIANNSTCDTAYYKVTIKDLVNSSINKDKINYQIVDKSTNKETIDKNPDNFNISDSLTKGNTKTYTIRLWIDESATNTDLFINGDTTKPIEYKYALNIESSDEEIKGAGMTATEFAQANVGQNGLEQITHTIDNTLQVDERFATEYRYRGGNSTVNNWVYFNCSDPSNQTDSTCEKWMIIGVIPTEDANGNVTNRFKMLRQIIRNGDLCIIKPSGGGGSSGGGNGSTDTLYSCNNNYANNTMYNYCFSENIINSNYTDYVDYAKYYLGGYSSIDVTPKQMWQYERKNEANREGYFYKDNQLNVTKKVAFLSISDHGYASSNCEDKTLNGDNSDNIYSCDNWILDRFDQGNIRIFINAGSASNKSIYHFSSSRIILSEMKTNSTAQVINVLTLSSNIKITGGKGTKTEPYQLSVE